MKIERMLLLLISALSCASCDKAEKLAEKATHAVRDQVASRTGAGKEQNVDPELAKLANQTADGVVFRKDLPFPERIEITTTRRQEWSGRFYRSSAIEQHTEVVKGTRTTITRLERDGDQVRYSLASSTFSEPVIEKSWRSWLPWNSETPAAKVLAGPSKPVVYKKSGSTWKSDDSDGFRAGALSKDLSPVFDQLLIDNALAPRPLWFSAKKRFKPGDELTVTGVTLPMLIGGNAAGTIHLKLESFDAFHSHPCAVFAVSGDYRRKDVPDFEGIFTDEDVTIQSGKLWLSIIHPIILKEELDTIQTVSSGSLGGEKSRGQGSIKVSVERQWKALAP